MHMNSDLNCTHSPIYRFDVIALGEYGRAIIHYQSSLTYDMAANYVVNELLAFVFFKYNADNMKDLETIICNFYGEEDVS